MSGWDGKTGARGLLRKSLVATLVLGYPSAQAARFPIKSIVRREDPELSAQLGDLAAAETSEPACVYTKPWQPKNNPSILFPLYTVGTKELVDSGSVCTNELIIQVSKGCRAVTAVVNPQSGPLPRGNNQIAAMRTCMKLLDDHNVTMVGYVHTKLTRKNPNGTWDPYAMRPPAEVKDDFNIWMEQTKGLKNFKGFFFDDTSSHWETYTNRLNVSGGHIAWYRKLMLDARAILPNATIILNPGSFVDLRLMMADPSENFTKPADITIPYEDYAWKWRPPGHDCSKAQASQAGSGTFEAGPWCRNIPKWDNVEAFKDAVTNRQINVSAVIHTATCEFAFEELHTAKNAGFRYFYATDATLSGAGPWYRVPSYWEAYLKFLDLGESRILTQQDYVCGGPNITYAPTPTTTAAPVPGESTPVLPDPSPKPSNARGANAPQHVSVVAAAVAMVAAYAL